MKIENIISDPKNQTKDERSINADHIDTALYALYLARDEGVEVALEILRKKLMELNGIG